MSAKIAQTIYELRLRLRVLEPPANVSWAAQLGRADLLPPARRGESWLEFDIPLEMIATSDGEAKVRGAAVQGPRGGRFLYLTTGTRAGDALSPWNRRAKISLENLPLDGIRTHPADAVVVLTGEIRGTAKDGGPACASVPLLGKTWAFATSSKTPRDSGGHSA